MTLTSPAAVMERLEDLDRDLAELANEVEGAAFEHFKAKRERELARARAFLTAKGTDTARRFMADEESADIGMEAEAIWEARKARLKVLETRANVGMSILRAQSRGGGA